MKPLQISAYTIVSALGRGKQETCSSLVAQRSGLAPCTFEPRLSTYTGMVEGLDEVRIPEALSDFDCRNNRLAQLALEQDGFMDTVEAARERYGAHRIAVLLGTSTSGIEQTEQAYAHLDPETGELPRDFKFAATHNLFATSDFVRKSLGLSGPANMISTACSSSAKVFASAWRMMSLGLIDAAVVGGVDSLARNTLFGFSSLELVSEKPCTPCAPDRSGISIGEAGGFALLEWGDRAEREHDLKLLGYGESSDAYHMSTPRPDGEGAALAMIQALERAESTPDSVGYINMHGTASAVNDSMEDKAISKVFGTHTPASATKGFTGHTLGAAGIMEAAISFIAMENSFLPGTINTREIDPEFTSEIILENRQQKVSRVCSNSFGFGGSNCSLIFGLK